MANIISCKSFYVNNIRHAKPSGRRINVMDSDIDEQSNVILLPDADVSEPDTDSDEEDIDFSAPIDEDSDDDPLPVRSKPTKKKSQYKWKSNVSLATTEIPFLGDPLVFEEHELLESVEYFSKYFTKEMLEMTVYQSNLFAVQKGRPLNTNLEEQCIVHGMLLKMGIVSLPRYNMYWSNEFRIPAVADLMPRNRFFDLLQNFHFTDNDLIVTARNDPLYDRFAKIRPLTDMLHTSCQTMLSGQDQCVDEQVIKFKGKHAAKQ